MTDTLRTETSVSRQTRVGAAAEVIEDLQERIRTGIYAPGQKLPAERVLSEELGVSRPTTREAIQALCAMNILEARRGSGVYVAGLHLAELLHPLRFALELNAPTLSSLFEIRLALEPLASSLAAIRHTPEDIERMYACVKAASKTRVSSKQFLALDIDLHELVVEAARNELLTNLVGSIGFLSHRSRELTIRQAGMREASLRDHKRIVKAIATGDSSRAEMAMRRHLERIWKVAKRATAQGIQPSRERRA